VAGGEIVLRLLVSQQPLQLAARRQQVVRRQAIGMDGAELEIRAGRAGIDLARSIMNDAQASDSESGFGQTIALPYTDRKPG
jgi:hypothetical protein